MEDIRTTECLVDVRWPSVSIYRAQLSEHIQLLVYRWAEIEQLAVPRGMVTGAYPSYTRTLHEGLAGSGTRITDARIRLAAY